jgi:AcrR family transcriptional regulator
MRLEMTEVAGAEIRDGRVRRKARNRESIVNALLELIGEGEIQPTAEQVAARAHVQPRTVFRHFADMESLHAELSARLQAEILPLLAAHDPKGGTGARARALVRARAAIYERAAPYMRAMNALRWRYGFMQRDHARSVNALRTHLQVVLPELRRAPKATFAAFELVTSFEAWQRLRSDQRLGPERAQAAMERAALALLP